ncbi:hypothetical protein [Serratia sp. M24T3]|uniref:tail fiber/spike domain-containing protein n=1 Tax=Serratia sp. M24T3 TaxID=932213 RepID=UPI00025BB669|nr:hypothetical protein [Serratia sp. M24T3]EIC83366.1 hypothetical protein SPM24T3_17185 [Serratia sp. M24T3]
MAFTDGQLLTAAELNDLANKADLDSAVTAKIDEINGYSLSAAQSADTAASNSTSAQNAVTLAQQAAAEAENSANETSATLAAAIKGSKTFADGATLTSLLDQINDGANLYYWTGAYPKTVAAGSSPGDDGYGEGYWAVVGDSVFRSELATSEGFKYTGQVASYAALKQVVPSYAGQPILLKSYYDKAATGSAKGGGKFVAVPFQSTVTEDNGSVCVVNSSWYWKRVIDYYYTPEMFGAMGDGSADDSAAINYAISAAFVAHTDQVRGDGIYSVKSQITLLSGYHDPVVSGQETRLGASLYLNIVQVDPTGWPSVPDNWWNAQAVFVPPANNEIESYKLHVNAMDCAGVASAISTTNAAINTSHLHIGFLRNFIIGYKDYLGQIFSSGMSYISGENWQDGYVGVLHGGTGNGGGNGECLQVEINWCANNRYGGVLFLDRSQYSQILGGTYDYNGQWASSLTLTNLSSSGAYDVEFGDKLTSGTHSGYALSSLMFNGVQNDSNPVLLITESANKKDGTSDYTVGDTITFGSWSATISAIALTSAVNINYFDIVISNRTADFSKCNIAATYVGGISGHNLFTNTILCANSYAVVDAINWRGLGIAGGTTSSYWYLKHLYGNSPVFEFYPTNLIIDKDVQIRNNAFYGSKGSYNAVVGTEITVMSFPAATDDLYPDYYTVLIGTSIISQYAKALIRVTTTSISIEESTLAYFKLDVSGFNLTANINGSDALITVTSRREM